MAQNSLFGESRKFEADKKHCLLLVGCQLIDFNWVEEVAMSICTPKGDQRSRNLALLQQLWTVELQTFSAKSTPNLTEKRFETVTPPIFYFHSVGDLSPYALGLGQIFPLGPFVWGWNGQWIYGSICCFLFLTPIFLLHRSKGATVGGPWMAWSWRNSTWSL